MSKQEAAPREEQEKAMQPIRNGTLGVPLERRREPEPKDMADPRFDVLWELMKRVDVDFRNGLFSGATGNDVCAVLDALDGAALSTPSPVSPEPGEMRHLASAMKKLLPPPLFDELLGYLDPLGTFVKELARPSAAPVGKSFTGGVGSIAGSMLRPALHEGAPRPAPKGARMTRWMAFRLYWWGVAQSAGLRFTDWCERKIEAADPNRRRQWWVKK